MSVAVTAVYASILAVILTVLGMNVTIHRAKCKVPLGDGGNPDMLRMIRIHGNAAEYVPIALVLMLLYEINGGSHALLHTVGVVLIVARLLHVTGLWRSTDPTFGRISGPTLTWLTTLVLAVMNVVRVL
jgi:uncharacterized membrane protein YecN with MAPEG domain